MSHPLNRDKLPTYDPDTEVVLSKTQYRLLIADRHKLEHVTYDMRHLSSIQEPELLRENLHTLCSIYAIGVPKDWLLTGKEDPSILQPTRKDSLP